MQLFCGQNESSSASYRLHFSSSKVPEDQNLNLCPHLLSRRNESLWVNRLPRSGFLLVVGLEDNLDAAERYSCRVLALDGLRSISLEPASARPPSPAVPAMLVKSLTHPKTALIQSVGDSVGQ